MTQRVIDMKIEKMFVELMSKKVEELKNICREHGITHYGNQLKTELSFGMANYFVKKNIKITL